MALRLLDKHLHEIREMEHMGSSIYSSVQSTLNCVKTDVERSKKPPHCCWWV